jgi:hypothetical protein
MTDASEPQPPSTDAEFKPKRGRAVLGLVAVAAVGGVRMKLAPIEQIAAAPDVVLLDDMTRGGHVERARQLNDIRLFSRSGYDRRRLRPARRAERQGHAHPRPLKEDRT